MQSNLLVVSQEEQYSTLSRQVSSSQVLEGSSFLCFPEGHSAKHSSTPVSSIFKYLKSYIDFFSNAYISDYFSKRNFKKL